MRAAEAETIMVAEYERAMKTYFLQSVEKAVLPIEIFLVRHAEFQKVASQRNAPDMSVARAKYRKWAAMAEARLVVAQDGFGMGHAARARAPGAMRRLRAYLQDTGSGFRPPETMQELRTFVQDLDKAESRAWRR